jgi:hypothetical protein
MYKCEVYNTVAKGNIKICFLRIPNCLQLQAITYIHGPQDTQKRLIKIDTR